MSSWVPTAKALKKYPHFDGYLSLDEISKTVESPERVAKNPFYPFIRYVEGWQPFRSSSGKPKKKERQIRYASRKDAAIFAKYRHELSDLYEKLLSDHGISHVPIAYRKIPTSEGSDRGKCNIHFAKDAFDEVRRQRNCCAISLDISDYFETLDHSKIKDMWKRLLGVSYLPDDHYAVFKAITRYAIVDRDRMYRRLGYLKDVPRGNATVPEYTRPYNRMPLKLCKAYEFRAYVAGDAPGYTSIIEKNDCPYGIPQGAPISDLIANFYLFDFDRTIESFVRARGGYYVRYSDDILMILPVDIQEAKGARDYVLSEITKHGNQIRIKPEKTGIVEFSKNGSQLDCQHVEGAQGANGLEFLGFRFNGAKVFIKDKTLSRFARKMTFAVRREANRTARRYPGKDASFVMQRIQLKDLAQRFGRVENFHQKNDYRDWTFWTYAKRASDIFGDDGRPIQGQVRRYKQKLSELIVSESVKAVARRKNYLGV
jgi:hypothetical protein